MHGCCSLGANLQHTGVHGSRYSHWYGASLDILLLLESSAAINASPLPQSRRLFPSRELHPRSPCRISRAHTLMSKVACRPSAHSHSLSQACSYTSSDAAQLCICLQAVLTGPWLLVSDCRFARSWSQATFEVRPGVDTNSKCLPSVEMSVRRTFRALRIWLG